MRLVSMFLVVAVLVSVSVVMAMDPEKEKAYKYPVPTTRGLLDCSNAIPIQCGGTYTGDNTGMPNNVALYSCTSWNEGGGEVVYELVLPSPDCWIVTGALSGMSADLDIFFLGSCDESDCLDYGNSSFTTECLFPGTYYVVVDGYGTAQSAFTMTISCEPCDCPVPPCCPFPYTCMMFDFNESDNNVMLMDCGGAPVWEWGVPEGIPALACDDVPVTNVLGTVLNGNYPPSAGEIAAIGPIFLDACCWCMELCHFYDTESGFDGANVKISVDGGVSWTLLTPARLYDRAAYSSPMCVGLEDVFSGHQFNTTFLRDCFDVSQYTGMDVMIGFFFGSDSSVQYPGWYIKWVKFGGYEPSATEETSWGSIKSMYR